MKTLGLIFLLIMLCGRVNGQSYSYEQILSKADSIFRANVDERLLKYFHRDSTSLSNRQDKIVSGQTTKGTFEHVLVFYNFSYKESIVNASFHKGYLVYSILIELDSGLGLANNLDAEFDNFAFIPQYVKDQRPCDFISMDKALEIAKDDGIKNGIEPPSAELDYSSGDVKGYFWFVNSPLTKETHDGRLHGEADTVIIDAVSGKILRHELTNYGSLH